MHFIQRDAPSVCTVGGIVYADMAFRKYGEAHVALHCDLVLSVSIQTSIALHLAADKG